MSAAILRGSVIDGKTETSVLFAAVDPSAHHVDPGVRSSRFSALLAPFVSRREAEAALLACGCNRVGEVGR
jgi:hypothetical protein